MTNILLLDSLVQHFMRISSVWMQTAVVRSPRCVVAVYECPLRGGVQAVTNAVGRGAAF